MIIRQSLGETGAYCTKENEQLKHDVFVEGQRYLLICQSCGNLMHVKRSNLNVVRRTSDSVSIMRIN
jgi:hypothetical protein